MIPLVSRGSGFFVPFYLGICLWLVGYWFPKRTFGDPEFTAWVFLFAALITGIHAFALFRESRRFQGHGARQPETIWENSFFFLPVIVWAIAFSGISIWNFTPR